MPTSEEFIKMDTTYGAHNYHPIPIVISKAEGIWVTDPEGKRYMDMLSAYSALNQGHRHPKIIKAVQEQMDRVTLTSRAFHNDKMGPFLRMLTEVAEMDVALPMNTGAEAVETGIKLARKWAYKVKRVPDDKAEIIVCENNFHGRTTTIVGFSSDFGSRDGFGPFTPGFITIPYNDPKALEEAITPNTAAFLVEPIQGEAGVVVPDEGYLKEIRRICTENNVLLMLDEIQTGFCRTGRMFCHQHEGIKPDIMLVGKALGGGIIPVSGALASKDIMVVMTPGDHGSTFGGNPLASAVAIASMEVLLEEKLDLRARETGAYFMEQLRAMNSQKLEDIRGKGLLIAVQLTPEAGPARQYTEALKQNGLLAKETHENTIRFAPPLAITKEEVDQAMGIIKKVLG